MEKYITAESYRNWELVGEPFKKNCSLYIEARHSCPRCGGKGVIPQWSFIDNGLCWQCKGSGVISKEVRLYTGKEAEAMQRARERRIAKKELEEQEKIKAKIINSEKNLKAWQVKHGFNEDGITNIIAGEDTFTIKDWLKEKGCKFDGLLKWHRAEPLTLPEGYELLTIQVSFDDVYIWDCMEETAFIKEDAKDFVENAILKAQGPSLSEYYGTVGERFYDLTAVLKSIRGFDGKFGWTFIYTFKSGDNEFTWFTSKDLELEKNTVVNLTATVKKHEEYKGVKTTILNRAIVKEI